MAASGKKGRFLAEHQRHGSAHNQNSDPRELDHNFWQAWSLNTSGTYLVLTSHWDDMTHQRGAKRCTSVSAKSSLTGDSCCHCKQILFYDCLGHLGYYFLPRWHPSGQEPGIPLHRCQSAVVGKGTGQQTQLGRTRKSPLAMCSLG